MRRRKFISLLGTTAAAWPLAAHAQQPAMPVIGFLNATSPDVFADRLRAFRQGLKEVGFVEGENLAIEYRWAENQFDRLPALAAELVRRKVGVIAATGGPATVFAAKAATTTIPIVFGVNEDPVRLGLVASLTRPGGNLTGMSLALGEEFAGKWIELLREAMPEASPVAILWNPANPANTSVWHGTQAAARALGLQLHAQDVRGAQDLEGAFALTAQALLESPKLEEFAGRVSDSGEGRWTSIAAIEAGVPAPVLTTALYSRFSSRGLDDFENRLLSAMRKQFGGHEEKKD